MQKFCIILVVAIVVSSLFVPGTVRAGFDPNFILSDYDFTDYTSLTLEDILRFLTKKGTLHRYVDPLTRLSAAQIISDAAKVYRISPKVLLVLLQKEQSLVEDGEPRQDQYDWATGYAVCDSCSKDDPLIQKFKGFTNQVTFAAKRFRQYLEEPNSFNFKKGQTHLIDGTPVTMLNDATRALYTYTPHLHGNELFSTIWNRWFAKLYPDSSVVLERETKKYYLIQDGYKREFKSKAVFLSRFNLEDAVLGSKTDLDKYPTGSLIKFAENTLIRSPKGTVYLVMNDQKRGFASREVLRKIGFSPEEIVDVNQEEVNGIVEGEPITIKSIYPIGALLQERSTGGVYFVKDGVKRPLLFRELLKINFPKKRIIPSSSAELAAYQTNEPVLLKEGLVVKSKESDLVYFISRGMKRPFTSEKAFTALGHHFSTIITVSQALLDLHETGETIDVEM